MDKTIVGGGAISTAETGKNALGLRQKTGWDAAKTLDTVKINALAVLNAKPLGQLKIALIKRDAHRSFSGNVVCYLFQTIKYMLVRITRN